MSLQLHDVPNEEIPEEYTMLPAVAKTEELSKKLSGILLNDLKKIDDLTTDFNTQNGKNLVNITYSISVGIAKVFSRIYNIPLYKGI